jgi:hypothetical protein
VDQIVDIEISHQSISFFAVVSVSTVSGTDTSDSTAGFWFRRDGEKHLFRKRWPVREAR